MGYAGLWTEKYSCTKETIGRSQVGIHQSSGLEIALSMEMVEKQALAMKTDVQNIDPEVKLLKVDRGCTGQWSAAPTTGNSIGDYKPNGKDGG